MGEGAGAGGGEAQHLKAMRQRAGMAPVAAIFDIVMDRVIVGRDRLKCREMCVGYGAARDDEALADREVLEIPALGKAMPAMVEILPHRSAPRQIRGACSAAWAARASISASEIVLSGWSMTTGVNSGMPSASRCTSASWRNSAVTTIPVGRPRVSRARPSVVQHDGHDPQSRIAVGTMP